MTDGQLLLLILWLIYGTDCFRWLPRHSLAFVCPWRARWSVRTASAHLGNAAGGILLLNPLPPLGQFRLHHVLPLSVSPEFVTAYNSQTVAPAGRPDQSGAVLALADLRGVEGRDGVLRLNGRPFVRFRSAALLQRVVPWLDALRRLPPRERPPAIEAFWRGQFDLAAAEVEHARIRDRTRGLRWLCNLQFAYLYLLLPAAMWSFGVLRLLIPAAALMFVLGVVVAIEFFAAHRDLYPAGRGERITHVIKMVLCPPVGIRALDLLMAPALASFHALTLAELLLPEARRTAFICGWLRDLRHPLRIAAAHAEVDRICRWQNDVVAAAAARRLPSVARCRTLLAQPPAREDNDRLAFCPRCLAQLAVRDTHCPDCPGVALVSFDAAAGRPGGPA